VKQRNSRRYGQLRAILRAAREEQGITQRQLSARLKRDKNFVQLVESGERLLDVVEYLQYCKVLRIDPRDVIGQLLEP
jgi:transcriptional regulator with XRE-family HTH domain